jgi:hypothetical protein
MRLAIGIIGTACLCGMSLAQADPPSSAPAPAAATPPSTQSATQAAPATTSSATPAQLAPAKDTKQTVVVQGTPEFDTLEKHFLSEGYKLEMHNGEKYFCRREDQLGSRLGGQKYCSTAQQLMVTERDAQRSVDRSMMQQNNPSGR